MFEAGLARAIQADYDQRKKAGGRSLLSGGGGEGAGEAPSRGRSKSPGGKREAPPEPQRADVALQKKALNAMAQNTIDKNVEASTNRKAALLRLLDRYYAQPRLAPFLPKPRLALTVRHDERDIIAALANVRAALNARGADMVVRSMLVGSARGAEYATMSMGFNPLGLDLTGFGVFFADDAVQATLEPEITEFCVEWQDWFASPYYVRFAMKVFQLANAYSEQQKATRARSAPVPASVAAAVADLGDH